MSSLILHSTDTAQWYALINEAQQSCSLVLTENVESYLVFLLMRFVNNSAMGNSILALEFLEAVSNAGKYEVDKLQEVGDKCLLFSGLFPERAKKINLEVSYFIEIGQSAYATFANHADRHLVELFNGLSNNFAAMATVLSATRPPIGSHKINIDIPNLGATRVFH